MVLGLFLTRIWDFGKFLYPWNNTSLILCLVPGLTSQFLNLGHLIDTLWYLATLLLKVRVNHQTSWTCRTTPCLWSRCPPGQFFWLGESRGSFWDTFTISTFLPEHSFMLKSYRWVGWVVAHKTLLSAPVPIRIGIWGLGLGLDNKTFKCHSQFRVSSRSTRPCDSKVVILVAYNL